jgi:signal transduction histidine kinase
MSYRDWFRPPRHLIALFLVLTLVPSLLLIAFGWRLLRHDLELEQREADAEVEQAADLIVAALEQSVASTEAAMRDANPFDALSPLDDAVVVAFTRTGVEVRPAGRLLFHPIAVPGREASPAIFADGEALEFRDREPVRAGASIRLARNLRKTGASAEALEIYARTSAPDSAVGGVPADLLARWARCELLDTLGREQQVREEGRRLVADLLQGRWKIDRAQFNVHFADASRWAGAGIEEPAPAAMSLAAAVEWLHDRWRQLDSGERFSGRDASTVDGVLITLLWQGTADRAVALVSGPRHVASRWLTKLASLHERHAVRASISDPEVRFTSTTTGRRRTAAETGLPWTVVVEGGGGAPGGRFAGRRAVWLAGLGIIALLVVSGTYVVVRAVSRELAVARLQSDFVSAVSHEFRTPLTSLRQLTEMLIERPATSAERRQSYYAALARQTDRLHRLVESLLDFGRMEAGTSPYRLAPLDAAAVITEIVQQFASDTAARGCDVRLEMPATAGTISGDRDALTNALWNLLDNAVKYSPDSRVVWIDVTSDGTTLAIAVRDRGMGIPANEQRDIFGKFVRGATARAGNINGTGIGLAMVSHVVKAHGGSIHVDSEPGQGSTFTLRLPLIPAPAGAAQEPACLGS